MHLNPEEPRNYSDILINLGSTVLTIVHRSRYAHFYSVKLLLFCYPSFEICVLSALIERVL